MKKYITDAIVLRNINYRDSNKIYTLLSSDLGKISALGRGVRKISSRRGGNLDTLNAISISITEDSKGFKSIDEAKNVNAFKGIKNSLVLITNALEIIELINIFIDSDQNVSGAFELLYKSLLKLDALSSDQIDLSELIVAEFKLRFMALSGYELTLDRCTVCGNDLNLPWESYWFSYSIGGIVCDKCGVNSGVSRIGSQQISKNSANILSQLSKGKNSLSEIISISGSPKTEMDLALKIATTHVNSIAENFYRKPKVHKMLYT